MTARMEAYTGLNGTKTYDSSDLTVPGGLLDGEVNISPSAPRRRLTARFIDPTGLLTPTTAADIFTVYGPEVRPFRGIRFPDGTIEDVPLGVFGISDVEIDDAGAGTQISITAYDRSRKVSRAKPVQDFVVAAGTNFATGIQAVISNAVLGLTFSFITTPYTTPQVIVKVGDDPWKVAEDMATSIGCDLFFDVAGICVLQPRVNFTAGAPVWNYSEGDDAIILYANKRLTDDKAYNYYIVTGDNSSNTSTVRADASDINPFSATYIYGPYGLVTAPVTSSKLIVTNAQAFVAAYGMLYKTIGFSHMIHFNAIPIAAHDIGDVVQITRAKSKINAQYILDQLSVPLTKDRALDAQTRLLTTVI